MTHSPEPPLDAAPTALCGHVHTLASGTVMRCVLAQRHTDVQVGHHYLAERWLTEAQRAALPRPA